MCNINIKYDPTEIPVKSTKNVYTDEEFQLRLPTGYKLMLMPNMYRIQVYIFLTQKKNIFLISLQKTLKITFLFFFLLQHRSDFRFYKLYWDLDRITSSVNDYHQILNKNLPEDIIREIISYLSPVDILILCNSSLFLPCLLNTSWFSNYLKAYFTHLLAISYINNKWLFLICALHPIIINNDFYFSVDFRKLSYFKELLDEKDSIFDLDPLTDVLILFNNIFHPSFKTLSKKHYKIARNCKPCVKKCSCHEFKTKCTY